MYTVYLGYLRKCYRVTLRISKQDTWLAKILYASCSRAFESLQVHVNLGTYRNVALPFIWLGFDSTHTHSNKTFIMVAYLKESLKLL